MTERLDKAKQCLERAYALETQNEFEGALEQCNAAVRLAPDLAEAHNLRGILLDELGQKQQAIDAYREAVRLAPTLRDAQENLLEAEAELREEKSFRKVSMEIRFDKPDRTYAPGDQVSGVVVVRANKECQCKRLTLYPHWRTHGRGSPETGYLRAIPLGPPGNLSPGTGYSHSFKFQAPSEPVTYHGHYLNVDWYAKATADVPGDLRSFFLKDLTGEAEFLLRSAETPVRVRPVASAEPISPWRFHVALIGIVLGLLWLVAAIVFEDGLGQVGIPLFAVVVGGLLSVYFWPEIKLGSVDVAIASREQEIQCLVRLAPRFRIYLEQVTATLNVDEVCITGSGSQQETHRYRLFRESTKKIYEQVVEAKQELEAELSLVFRSDLPPSLKVGSSKIEWSIAIEISPSGPFAWKHKVPIFAYR